MVDGSFDVQTTVYGILNALDPPLAAGGIHASAPQDQPLPYVEMGDADATQLDVERRTGLDEFLTIHVWTRFGSYAEVKTIMSRIRDSLHQKTLTVEGRSAALSTVKSSQVFADSDEQSLHGIISLRVAHWSHIVAPPMGLVIDFVGDPVEAATFITHTRALAAYARNVAGVLTSFAVDTPRITDMGLLVEGERTNYCQESSTVGITNGLSSWSQTGCSVTANNALAPDGTTTATLLTDNAVSTSHFIRRNTIVAVNNQQVAISIFAKAGTKSYAYITYGNVTVIFDLVNGKWQNWYAPGTAHYQFYNAYMEEFDDGWWRITSVVLAKTGNQPTFGMAHDDTFRLTPTSAINNVAPYTGDTTGTLWFWGPQIEIGAFASSYTPTVGKVTETRPADVIAFTGAADTVLNVPNTTAASVVAEVLLPDGATAQKIITGVAGTPILLGQSSSDDRRATFSVSTAIDSGQSLNGAAFTTSMKVGSSWDASGRTVVAGLGAIANGSAEAFSADTRYLGDSSTVAYIRGIQLWSIRLSDQALRVSTTFNAPVASTASSPETSYFSRAGDRVTFLDNAKSIWTATGGATPFSDGLTFYTAAFARTVGSTPVGLPSTWLIGGAPRLFNVNAGAATVSIGGATTAPDSSSDAAKIIESTTTSEHYLYAGLAGGTGLNEDPGIRHCYSVFLKAGERTRAVLIATDTESGTRGGINGVKALFDLVAGEVVDSYTYGAWKDELIAAEITPWGSGWYRCTLKFLAPWFDNVTHLHQVKYAVMIDAGFGDNPERSHYPGDGASGLYMWKGNDVPMGADAITDSLLYDDFDSAATVDVNDTRLPGYNWYTHLTFPTLADASTYSEATNTPVMPELFEIQDSHFRVYPRPSSVGNAQGARSIAWVGNEADARATGEGLCEADTPWEEVRELFVGKVFKAPFLIEGRNKVVEYDAFDLEAFWTVDARSFFAPYLNPDGTPIQLLWPTPVIPKTEIDIKERNSGFTAHFVVYASDGSFTNTEKVSFTQVNIVAYLNAGTNEGLYATERTWQCMTLPTTVDDIGMCLYFMDGLFVFGLITAASAGWTYRPFLDTQYQALWINGIETETYWVEVHGAPDSVSTGLATGPL